MKKFNIEVHGDTPLLMHWDNIDWADAMDEWRADPKNKKSSKAGDDRTPAFRWIGSVYHDGVNVTMPADNIMRCFMEGGAMVPVPGGRGNKTFKAQSQSGMTVSDTAVPLLIEGKALPWSSIVALKDVPDFKTHREQVESLGFSLFVKRAKIGTSKHIRVRPRFNSWSMNVPVTVWDDQITKQVLQDIATYAGQYKGLCDWRPGGKTPGSYGMFNATVHEV